MICLYSCEGCKATYEVECPPHLQFSFFLCPSCGVEAAGGGGFPVQSLEFEDANTLQAKLWSQAQERAKPKLSLEQVRSLLHPLGMVGSFNPDTERVLIDCIVLPNGGLLRVAVSQGKACVYAYDPPSR